MSDASFEAPSFEQWRALVDKTLKGAPFESLTTATLEGIPIAPLYGERDRPCGEGIPWAPRARRAVGLVHWDAPEPSREAERGATLAWLRGAAPPAGDPAIDVIWESHLPSAVRAASRRVRVVADAFGDAGIGGTAPGDPPLLDAIAEGIGRGAPVLGVSACAFDDVGSGAVTQLAAIGASLVASLRAMERRGVDLERAVEGTTVALCVDADLFLGIAKLRAARRIVARVLEAAGIGARPWIAARTSDRVHARLDRPTNLLRETLAVTAALVGGADAVAASPHAEGEVAVRTARNVPLVLLLESHLAATADPTAGSAYVERRTSELARAAWDLVARVESAGGIVAGSAILLDRAREEAGRRSEAIVTRRAPIVGVSRFPVSGEAIREASPRGDARPFEELRVRAVPASRVVRVGACPEARVDFAREVAQLASYRVEVVEDVTRGDASFVILAAPDAELGTSVVEAARALASAGAKVAVAGKPGVHEQALRDAGVSSFVFVGADVVDALWALLPREGA